MTRWTVLGIALLCATAIAAVEVPAEVTVEARLATPLTTRVRLPLAVPLGAVRFHAQVRVPESAPADLGLALYCHDRAGRWRQAQFVGTLAPGSDQGITLDLPACDALAPPDAEAVAPGEVGLLLWSAGSCRGRVTVRGAGFTLAPAVDVPPRLLDLRADPEAIATGATWSLSARPWPAPIDGFDRGAFALDATLRAPDGTARVLRARSEGRRVTVRVRPPLAGQWGLDLAARWRSGTLALPALATLAVLGEPPPLPTGARPLRLRAPLATDHAAEVGAGAQARLVRVEVVVPDDAPADLAAIGWLRDGDGSWRQAASAVQLEPGRAALVFAIPARAWPALDEAPTMAGIRFVSALGGDATLLVGTVIASDAPTGAGPARLLDATFAEGEATLGATWAMSARPVGGAAALVTTVVDPIGRVYPVGWSAPRAGICTLALHPVRAGEHVLRLVARWPDGRSLSSRLPTLVASGPALAPRAQELRLAAPLVTRMAVPAPAGVGLVQAVVVIGDDAPADLGVAAWVSDRHGRWYQTPPQALTPGRHQLRFTFERAAAVAGVGHGARWSPAEAAKAVQAGLVFWSASATPAVVQVAGLAASAAASPPVGPPRLLDLALAAFSDGASRVRAGERWELALRPFPAPANPFAAEECSVDLVVTPPDGVEQRIPAFFAQDMRRADGGNRELVTASAPATFAARFRPRQPGRHALRLEARLAGGALRCALPPLTVEGPAWDDYVRIDRGDPRFFATAGKPYWPIGPNLRSVWDVRSRENLGTKLTADRGTLAYDAYLDRYAAAGANAVEIWLSSWNLALEWRGDWPGFHGMGRFNEENAWRLDRVLDRAWARGLRVNLVINNHGQASDNTDREWENNPWNRTLGGPLARPEHLFTDPRALAGQQRLRRYLVGRYADHPAILGWKLWSEQDLTNGKRAGVLPGWHAQATAAWRAIDSYAHPVTSHWCGNYRHPDPAVITHLDYVCIDAYHGYKDDDRFRFIHDLLAASTLDPEGGLAVHRKPVLVTEFGGNWNAAPTHDLLAVDHAVGPWAALVSGHAGAPMLWWFEWLDQDGRWGPYRALADFLAGEDPRGADARAATLATVEPAGLWTRAWIRPGRILGYCLDPHWARSGGRGRALSGVRIAVGDAVAAGTLRVEWWNADDGGRVAAQDLRHSGGRLELVAPVFHRHLAFKLLRQP